jgi:hypothetical protein
LVKLKIEIMGEFENFEEKMRYEQAVKRVKKIKGFYTHAVAYVLVNLFIVYLNFRNLPSGESYFQAKNFVTAFFWGIGLFAHGVSVFGQNLVFGKNWEERKIKELMEKDNNINKWE